MASHAPADPAYEGAPRTDPSPRATRFAARLRGEREPTFADLARKRRLEERMRENRAPVAATLALLACKPALDAQLCGRRLGTLAQLVGEDLLDRIRNVEVPPSAIAYAKDDLPPSAMLHARGNALLTQIGEDPQLGALAEIAVQLVGDSPVQGNQG